jgi:hypothetical protein
MRNMASLTRHAALWALVVACDSGQTTPNDSAVDTPVDAAVSEGCARPGFPGSPLIADNLVFRVAAADLDGDGKLDLIRAGNDPYLGVRWGNGDGTFSNVQVLLDQQVSAVAIGDLDADGLRDVIVMNSQTQVLVLRNKGARSFATAVQYSASVGVSSMSVADITGDGKHDLVLLTGAGFSIMRNDGAGVLLAEEPHTVTGTTSALATADLTNDGLVDVAVIYEGNVTVFVNQGGGSFAAPVSYAVGNSPAAITAGDLDGDGDSDLVVGTLGGVARLMNTGNGTFGPARLHAGGPVHTVVIDDIDRNGKSDVVAVGWKSLTIHYQQAASTYASIVHEGVTYVDAVVGDFDGVGGPDVLTANSTGIHLMLNRGNGSFAVQAKYPAGYRPWGLDVADANADGFPDLAVRNTGYGTTSVYLNRGDGTLATPQEYTGITGLFADLDGDGHVDLFEHNKVRLNDGAGRFGAPQTIPSEYGLVTAVADVDQDGRVDVLRADRTTLWVHRNLGGLSFAPFASSIFNSGNSEPRAIAVGDLDGDGLQDVVVAGELTTSVLRGHSSGGLVASAYYPVGGYTMQLVDKNNDGRLDILLSSRSEVRVLLNQGTSFAVAPPLMSTVRAMTIADVNDDGRADLVGVGETPGDSISIALDLGSSYSAAMSFPTGYYATGVATSDLDRDGFVDLIVTNIEDGTISVLRGGCLQ